MSSLFAPNVKNSADKLLKLLIMRQTCFQQNNFHNNDAVLMSLKKNLNDFSNVTTYIFRLSNMK